jgi:hypothetical protein
MKTLSCPVVVCPYCKARIEPEEQDTGCHESGTQSYWHHWNVCASASDQLVEVPPQ